MIIKCISIFLIAIFQVNLGENSYEFILYWILEDGFKHTAETIKMLVQFIFIGGQRGVADSEFLNYNFEFINTNFFKFWRSCHGKFCLENENSYSNYFCKVKSPIDCTILAVFSKMCYNLLKLLTHYIIYITPNGVKVTYIQYIHINTIINFQTIIPNENFTSQIIQKRIFNPNICSHIMYI